MGNEQPRNVPLEVAFKIDREVPWVYMAIQRRGSELHQDHVQLLLPLYREHTSLLVPHHLCPANLVVDEGGLSSFLAFANTVFSRAGILVPYCRQFPMKASVSEMLRWLLVGVRATLSRQ